MRLLARVAIAFTLFLPLLASAPAHAQASRTWVSGVGDDANPCSRTAPCKTFAGAISKTAVNGEINCLDPGGFGAVTIVKSITIDCTGELGSILNAGTAGINIAITEPTDVRKTVRLRNLVIQGFDSGLIGINILNAAAVYIENVAITGNFGGSAAGISDTRSPTPGALYIKDTSVTHLGGAGVAIAGASGNTAILDNVTSDGNKFGVAVAAGNRVNVSRSTLAGNSVAGVEADPGCLVVVDGSSITGNNIGVQSSSAVRMSNNNIAFNSTAISGATGTFGNNRFSGNSSAGTTPTPIGAASSDLAQQ